MSETIIPKPYFLPLLRHFLVDLVRNLMRGNPLAFPRSKVSKNISAKKVPQPGIEPGARPCEGRDLTVNRLRLEVQYNLMRLNCVYISRCDTLYFARR